MKQIAVLSFLIISFNSFAGTVLECRNQNNKAVYSLVLDDGNENLQLSPSIKDESVLSSSNAALKYYEGESSPESSLYGGANENGNKIALELNIGRTAIINKADVVDSQKAFHDDVTRTIETIIEGE